MANITLYTNKMSRGRIVQWMLEEMGVEYDIHWVNFGPRMKVRSYTAINPMGKVPALQHGDAIITETAAILTYLADTFPEKALIPPHGSPERAAFYRWMFFIAGPLESALTVSVMRWITPEKTPWDSAATGFLGFGTLALTLNTLENHLKQSPFVCGDQFTAADVYLASHLAYGIYFAKAYASRPIFDDYLKRMQARPAKQCVDAA